MEDRSCGNEAERSAVIAALVRRNGPTSRAELGRASGLGRKAVAEAVEALARLGVLLRPDLGPSTGGRPPRRVQLDPEFGRILAASLGATAIHVAVTDFSGGILDHREEPADVADGPEAILGRVDEIFREMILGLGAPIRIRAVGIAVPGPVEFSSGRPVSPPIMPGWDGYPIREVFVNRYGVPVWVDNDVNVLALGELREGAARDQSDAIFIKVGTGIGAGLLSKGQLHRGAEGAAGDIGHIQVVDDPDALCRCGNIGCLEAVAGGAALARDANKAAAEGRSPQLRRLLAETGSLTAQHVAIAAAHGDPVSVMLLNRAGQRIGQVIAALVNFYNPAMVILGGGVMKSGDQILAAIRHVVYARSLPLATRHLLIARSTLGDQAGEIGAAAMVLDELFTPELLPMLANEARVKQPQLEQR